MFYVKSKSKRKNVMTSLVVALLMIGGIILDSSLESPQQNQSTELSYSDNVQQAGWFWGRHVKGKKEVYRVFGITVKTYDSCATYD